MLTLRGPKLPDNAKLSDYVTDDSDNVRITNLRAGQTVEVDVTLDGGYDNPRLPVEAGWSSPVTGREGVHTPMIAVTQSEAFAIHCTGKTEARNSRGRGITISDCSGFEAHDLWVRGARTAGIAVHGSSGFTMVRPVTIDTGNYQSAKGQGKNWPGSIKMEGCKAYRVIEPASIDHMGNGITPTECSGGDWISPFAYAVHGAMIYINASPGQIIDGGFCIGGSESNRPAAYVLNSEEENEGAPDGVIFEACNSVDVSWGFAIWGNERKPNVVIQSVAMLDGVLISDNGSKIHPNAVVLSYDDAGTLLIKPSDLPANVLANLRMLSDRLAAAYRAHADAEVITAARVALGAAFAALREPVIEPEPPAIDRARLEAWFEEGEGLRVQLWDWHARGWEIARGK